jgi:hypothetical protein
VKEKKGSIAIFTPCSSHNDIDGINAILERRSLKGGSLQVSLPLRDPKLFLARKSLDCWRCVVGRLSSGGLTP